MNLPAKIALLLAAVAGVAAGMAGCGSRASAVAGPVVCTIPHEEGSARAGAVRPGRADLTGHTRIGKASFYARSFANRKMANGRRMDPQGDNAASRTLPLGTTAKVINIRTGQSAIVSIEDRGPYVKGRIVDLSPATARKIGITRHIGVAEVKVAPIAVQLPNGRLKPGFGARTPVCGVATS